MSKAESRLPIIRPPRLTRAGWWLLMWRYGLPFFVLLALIDALLFVIFRYGFDMCYGVFCLL